MRWDFKLESCFSGVLEYPGLVVARELVSDGAELHWLLLLMFLCLPLAIWLSLVLTSLGVSYKCPPLWWPVELCDLG